MTNQNAFLTGIYENVYAVKDAAKQYASSTSAWIKENIYPAIQASKEATVTFVKATLAYAKQVPQYCRSLLTWAKDNISYYTNAAIQGLKVTWHYFVMGCRAGYDFMMRLPKLLMDGIRLLKSLIENGLKGVYEFLCFIKNNFIPFIKACYKSMVSICKWVAENFIAAIKSTADFLHQLMKLSYDVLVASIKAIGNLLLNLANKLGSAILELANKFKNLMISVLGFTFGICFAIVELSMDGVNGILNQLLGTDPNLIQLPESLKFTLAGGLFLSFGVGLFQLLRKQPIDIPNIFQRTDASNHTGPSVEPTLAPAPELGPQTTFLNQFPASTTHNNASLNGSTPPVSLTNRSSL